MIFPQSITLESAREAIRNTPEFYEKRQDDIIVFNYRYSNQKTFPDPMSVDDENLKLIYQIRRECRGLIFSAETEQVISRRYHKFFNIGELPETAHEHIDLDQHYLILTKYDGVLVTPVLTNGKIRFASKSGFGDVTNVIEERFTTLEKNNSYSDFSQFWIDKNFTPIFEWCSPRNQIVLEYEDDNMVLTGIRHSLTGEYVPYDEMKATADEYGILLTEAEEGTIHDLEEFENSLKSRENIEGVVIRFDNGVMYKVKTTWYFGKSKKDKQEYSFNSERSIWRMILDQTIDDACATLIDTHMKEKVREFEVELYDAIERYSLELIETAKRHKVDSKKDYVTNIRSDETIDERVHALLFMLFNPEVVASDILIDFIIKNCGNQQSHERMKEILQISFSEAKSDE